MRNLVMALGFSLVVLSGCAADEVADPCGGIVSSLRVDQVTGDDILVDNRSLVLHASGSEIFVQTAEGCEPGTIADIRVRDRVGHDATEMAASYPGQASPDNIVVERV